MVDTTAAAMKPDPMPLTKPMRASRGSLGVSRNASTHLLAEACLAGSDDMAE